VVVVSRRLVRPAALARELVESLNSEWEHFYRRAIKRAEWRGRPRIEIYNSRGFFELIARNQKGLTREGEIERANDEVVAGRLAPSWLLSSFLQACDALLVSAGPTHKCACQPLFLIFDKSRMAELDDGDDEDEDYDEAAGRHARYSGELRDIRSLGRPPFRNIIRDQNGRRQPAAATKRQHLPTTSFISSGGDGALYKKWPRLREADWNQRQIITATYVGRRKFHKRRSPVWCTRRAERASVLKYISPLAAILSFACAPDATCGGRLGFETNQTR
jgi:hypothetical protein